LKELANVSQTMERLKIENKMMKLELQRMRMDGGSRDSSRKSN